MPRKASDIMQSEVVSVSPEASLAYVQRLLYDEGISGVPVVDEKRRVVGIVSAVDLVRAAVEQTGQRPVYPYYLLELIDPGSGAGAAIGQEPLASRLEDCRVGDFMTLDVCAVAPEASLAEVARTLLENRIHRVVVTEKGQLRGLISSFDLLGEIAKSG